MNQNCIFTNTFKIKFRSFVLCINTYDDFIKIRFIKYS